MPMMYQQQAAAYDAARRYGTVKTNSTPDTPPTVTRPDVAALCATKRGIVEKLPTHCPHCQKAYPANSTIERSNGEIVSYCNSKEAGACGKSCVRFVMPDLRVPTYKKFCAYDPVPAPPVDPNAAMMQTMPVPSDPEWMCQRCGKPHGEHPADADQNGWAAISYETTELPADWPVWNSGKNSWTPKRAN